MILTEKEYSLPCLVYGGKLEEAAQPLIFRFPNPFVKRKIRARITSWKGVGIGLHYWSSWEVENNAVMKRFFYR